MNDQKNVVIEPGASRKYSCGICLEAGTFVAFESSIALARHAKNNHKGQSQSIERKDFTPAVVDTVPADLTGREKVAAMSIPSKVAVGVLLFAGVGALMGGSSGTFSPTVGIILLLFLWVPALMVFHRASKARIAPFWVYRTDEDTQAGILEERWALKRDISKFPARAFWTLGKQRLAIIDARSAHGKTLELHGTSPRFSASLMGFALDMTASLRLAAGKPRLLTPGTVSILALGAIVIVEIIGMDMAK